MGGGGGGGGGDSPVSGEFPAQRASNAENVSIRWRHHVTGNNEGTHAVDGIVSLVHSK